MECKATQNFKKLMSLSKPKLVVLSGAGISAESGIKTFRDHNGLWENFDVMEVASIDGYLRNPDLVNEFYNARRAQLLTCHPNAGHLALVDLEAYFDVCIVTQNVDDLHERAGSSQVIHLHGELLKVRSSKNLDYVIEWREALRPQDSCPAGFPLRPHIVFFGEEVPMMQLAAFEVQAADILIVVGTSLEVYPAAGLVHCLGSQGVELHYVDPKPTALSALPGLRSFQVWEGTSAVQLPLLRDQLIEAYGH